MFAVFFRKSRALLLALVLWPLGQSALAQTMRVHFIDVGQGAATLVEFSCGAMLIDGGGESPGTFDSSGALVRYLDKFFEFRPDLANTLQLLAISHPHIDHTRGIKAVLERYRIKNAITNGRRGSPQNGGDQGQIALWAEAERTLDNDDPSDDLNLVTAWTHEIPKGKGATNEFIDPINCPDIDPKIRLLWGSSKTQGEWTAEGFKNQNNHSVVLRVDFGKASMLVSGDLQEEAIGSLLKHHRASKILDVDLYQVGHHGSHNATTIPFLQAMTPKIAVMATGPAAREGHFTAFAHGHPRAVTVEKLVAKVRGTRSTVVVPVAIGQRTFNNVPISKAIYATGWDGSMVFEATAAGVWKRLPPTEVLIQPAGDDEVPQLVNLNTATEEQLEALPLIGPAKAKAIVENRALSGPFDSADALQRVRGIGKATVDVLRNLVTVRP